MLPVSWSNKFELKRKIILISFLILVTVSDTWKRKNRHTLYGKHRTTGKHHSFTKTVCTQLDNTLRARHKSCFLRPDTGPCRADIVQWYFDVKQRRCYRFFWGGCQGNGNRFDSQKRCLDYCFLNTSKQVPIIPHYCSLSFDYGTCFGYFNRWHWDKFSGTCKIRLYSGCGGNQNNFETRQECLGNCMRAPNNTLLSFHQFTTCIPVQVADLQ